MSTFDFSGQTNGTTLDAIDALWAGPGESTYNVQSGKLQPAAWSANVAVYQGGQPSAQRSEIVLPAAAVINDGLRLYVNNTDLTAATGYYAVITTTGVEWRRLGTWSGTTSVTVDTSVQQTLALIHDGAGNLRVERNGTLIASYTDGTPQTGGAPGFQLDGGGTPGGLALMSWTDGIALGPTITAQPQSVAVTAGATPAWSVSATGSGTLHYAWTYKGAAVSGNDTATYSPGAVALADDGAAVTVTVSDTNGSTLSATATLAVGSPAVRAWHAAGAVPAGTLGWLGRPSSGSTTLGAGANVQASASAVLTTQIPLVGAALVVSSASGALTTQIPLAGAAASLSSASGQLTASIRFGATALAQAVGAAALSTGIPLSAAAQATASALASLASPAAALSASAVDQAVASGNLSTLIALVANAQDQAAGTAALSVQITLGASAVANAQVTAALLTQIRLAAQAQASAGASATLAGTSAPLQAQAQAQAVASGSLTAQIRLSAQALAQAIAGGGLTTNITMSAAATVAALASAGLSTAIQLAADMHAQAAAAGNLQTAKLLAGDAHVIATGSADLTASIRLGADAVAVTNASATLSGAPGPDSPTSIGSAVLMGVQERIGTAALVDVQERIGSALMTRTPRIG